MSARDGAAPTPGWIRSGRRAMRLSGTLASMAGSWMAAELPPQVLAAQAAAVLPGWPGPVQKAVRDVAAQRAGEVLDRALTEQFGPGYRDQVTHPRQLGPTRPRGLTTVLRYRRTYCAGTTDIRYGTGGVAHTLDIWRRPGVKPAGGAPVLVHIPGGAWSVNDKRGQGYVLLAAMAERGWIGVSVNYRRSPHHAWPAHVVDVKRALSWVGEHIEMFGGDPDFIAVTGGSAGGHLSALAALTPNDPRWQPGFEEADTTVRAAVPMYGVFDLTDDTHMHHGMMGFLERSVLQVPLAEGRADYEVASPVYQVSADAPPFFVLHGAKDTIVPPGQSRVFAAALREANAPTVVHAELPNAHHLFDAVGSVRSYLAADAAADFLGIAYGRHLAERGATGGLTTPSDAACADGTRSRGR